MKLIPLWSEVITVSFLIPADGIFYWKSSATGRVRSVWDNREYEIDSLSSGDMTAILDVQT